MSQVSKGSTIPKSPSHFQQKFGGGNGWSRRCLEQKLVYPTRKPPAPVNSKELVNRLYPSTKTAKGPEELMETATQSEKPKALTEKRSSTPPALPQVDAPPKKRKVTK